jgi:hypothetical protein
VCAVHFLCGVDNYSGQSYEHRCAWVQKCLLFLPTLFAIDFCAYAVMSNHVHVVLLVDKDEALSWTVDEVLNRYHKLHKGTLLTQKYVRWEALSPDECNTFNEMIDEYRRRLHDISWLMREVNE